MSLGLPEFGSRGRASTFGPWRVIQLAGFLVLAYTVIIGGLEWREASAESEAIERTRSEVAQVRRTADDSRRALQKNADLLVAAQSLESSPAIVLRDLEGLLPAGVAIALLKIDYQSESLARVDFTVIAGTPESYDRFLNALSTSSAFSDIKPGSESRPGSVRATVTASHRPATSRAKTLGREAARP